MVLQGTPRKAVIWGYAPSGSEQNKVQVILEPDNQVYYGVVSADLTWTATIGKHFITILILCLMPQMNPFVKIE